MLTGIPEENLLDVGCHFQGAAGFAIDEIDAVTECPADFEAFWFGVADEIRETPENAPADGGWQWLLSSLLHCPSAAPSFPSQADRCA